MKKLLVYADFDWLKEIELIGELSYESLRGSDSFAFQFNDEWLKRYGNLYIWKLCKGYTKIENIKIYNAGSYQCCI